MNIVDAQKDMRYGFFGGGVGMFVSGTIWLFSGIIALNGNADQAIWALLIGGALIAPLSGIITKFLGRPDKSTPGNPLVTLAMEVTIWLIFCLPLAYTISQTNSLWFFPAMLLVIGGRYLTFSTIYGMRIYWVCGLLLAAASVALVRLNVPFSIQPFIGALIEIAFAPFVFIQGHKEGKLST
ncbi:MAG: hypothetical protein IPL71_12580 [Anaerolineales bacterium]|uniref:DUF7010 family protein n=1 Tax=Candidatus Villigracilis proximus TaxID=3140683 RepID=UPI0031353A2E|nr:hypothetical protein [Anaerolineales bacterium]